MRTLAQRDDRDVLSLQMVTFNATVISNSTAIKSSKGVANAAEKQAETDNTLMLTSVQAGTMLTDVALFVTQTAMPSHPRPRLRGGAGESLPSM